MTTIGLDVLTACQAEHPETRKELERWRRVMSATNFQTGLELHTAFRKTHDFAKPHCHVFDIVGGNFRLIAFIDFGTQTIVIDRIMNHKQYDRWECI